MSVSMLVCRLDGKCFSLRGSIFDREKTERGTEREREKDVEREREKQRDGERRRERERQRETEKERDRKRLRETESFSTAIYNNMLQWGAEVNGKRSPELLVNACDNLIRLLRYSQKHFLTLSLSIPLCVSISLTFSISLSIYLSITLSLSFSLSFYLTLPQSLLPYISLPLSLSLSRERDDI